MRLENTSARQQANEEPCHLLKGKGWSRPITQHSFAAELQHVALPLPTSALPNVLQPFYES